jgi:hypothetical protein
MTDQLPGFYFSPSSELLAPTFTAAHKIYLAMEIFIENEKKV